MATLCVDPPERVSLSDLPVRITKFWKAKRFGSQTELTEAKLFGRQRNKRYNEVHPVIATVALTVPGPSPALLSS